MNYGNQNQNPGQNQNQQNPQLVPNIQTTNTKFGDENASELAQSAGEISRILATQSLEIGSLLKGQNANAALNQNQAANQNFQNQQNNNQQNNNLYQSELEQSQGQISQTLANQANQ